jgi:hypothetical protein
MPVAIAIVVDTTQLITKAFHAIPLVGSTLAYASSIALAIASFLGFYLYFKLHDVDFTERMFAKQITVYVNTILEMVPVLNGFWPGVTVFTMVTIWLVRKEDQQYNADMRASAQQQAAQYQHRAARRR